MEVVVRLGRPELDASGENWRCPYEVQFGDSTETMAMHGTDPLQALQLSMATLDVELEVGAGRRGGMLYYLDEPFTSILENSGLQLAVAGGSPSGAT